MACPAPAHKVAHKTLTPHARQDARRPYKRCSPSWCGAQTRHCRAQPTSASHAPCSGQVADRTRSDVAKRNRSDVANRNRSAVWSGGLLTRLHISQSILLTPAGSHRGGGSGSWSGGQLSGCASPARTSSSPRPSPRTNWTRLVPPPVLTGHVSAAGRGARHRPALPRREHDQPRVRPRAAPAPLRGCRCTHYPPPPFPVLTGQVSSLPSY